jgi:hypothetical protein
MAKKIQPNVAAQPKGGQPIKTYFVEAAELDIPGAPCAGVVLDMGTRLVVASAIETSHGPAIAAALARAIDKGAKPDRVVVDFYTPAGELRSLCQRHGIGIDYVAPSHCPVVAHGAIERTFRDLERLFDGLPAAFGIPDIIDTGATR